MLIGPSHEATDSGTELPGATLHTVFWARENMALPSEAFKHLS